MAIASDIIGSLNTPGYGFLNETPNTYILPPFHSGVSIFVARWRGSDPTSYDLLDKNTGSVLKEVRPSSSLQWENLSPSELNGAVAKGMLMRINNSTPTQVYIIPNRRQTPPVWNGQ